MALAKERGAYPIFRIHPIVYEFLYLYYIFILLSSRQTRKYQMRGMATTAYNLVLLGAMTKQMMLYRLA